MSTQIPRMYLQFIPWITQHGRWYYRPSDKAKNIVQINVYSWVPKHIVVYSIYVGILRCLGYDLYDASTLGCAYIANNYSTPDKTYGVTMTNTSLPPDFDKPKLMSILQQGIRLNVAARKLQSHQEIVKQSKAWKLVYLIPVTRMPFSSSYLQNVGVGGLKAISNVLSGTLRPLVTPKTQESVFGRAASEGLTLLKNLFS